MEPFTLSLSFSASLSFTISSFAIILILKFLVSFSWFGLISLSSECFNESNFSLSQASLSRVISKIVPCCNSG